MRAHRCHLSNDNDNNVSLIKNSFSSIVAVFYVVVLVNSCFCWRLCAAAGGALDSAPHQTTKLTTSQFAPSTSTSSSPGSSSSSTNLGDGLAKTITHEGRDRKHKFFLPTLLFFLLLTFIVIVYHFVDGKGIDE